MTTYELTIIGQEKKPANDESWQNKFNKKKIMVKIKQETYWESKQKMENEELKGKINKDISSVFNNLWARRKQMARQSVAVFSSDHSFLRKGRESVPYFVFERGRIFVF